LDFWFSGLGRNSGERIIAFLASAVKTCTAKNPSKNPAEAAPTPVLSLS
jgi:hypothetical protein